MPVESPEERTVEVVAPCDEVDEELLSLYFENKRRSGGGPLISVEKKGGRAVLVFEEAEAAARVLSKGHHILHNVELSVRKPPSTDRHRLLLRGINPNTSMEMIELYVENMIGLSDQDYTLHPSPGRDFILIHLSQPFSKDFHKVSTHMSRRTLDGAQLTLEQIEQTDSILVENLHPGTSPDLLTLYFESNRGGNQKVKEVTLLSEATAKVSFASYESVDPVLARPHKLDAADLVVKPYFDFLQPIEHPASQLPESEGQDVAERMNDIQMQTSPTMTANSSTSPQAALEPMVASSSVAPQVALEPMVASSSTSPQTAMEPLVQEAVEEVSEVVMEDQSEDVATLSSHIPISDPVKQALFDWSTFQQDIKKAHPDFTIQMKDDGVHIEGSDSVQVEQLKNTILDFVGNMAETNFALGPEMVHFLARKDVKERLLEAMKKSGLCAVYAVSDSNVVVTSLSQDTAKQACSFLKSQVCHVSMPVGSEYECMMQCREWTEFLQALSLCSVKMSEREGNIDVWTLKGMENEKQTAIQAFLTTPIERETVISMEPGMLKYIQIHCHQLLADMNQVSIFPIEAEEVCGLKIHGHAVACQMAEEVLQGVVSSIRTKTITVNAPGVTRFLHEKDCMSIMHEMEAKFQVYISIKHVPWESLPYENFFDTTLRMMGCKNFNKGSIHGSAQELKSDSMQTGYDGVSDEGLLQEAKRIVSAIDGGLAEDVSATDQLIDLDNMDLYTAEEPSSLKDSTDSDVTTVEASWPSAEQNAASALRLLNGGASGLPSDLEEEAQLSLAIQYSMESNHWSVEDEEEQLQKALELSKKLIQHQRCTMEQTPQANKVQKSNINMSLEDSIKAANSIQLHVFAGYDSDLSRVDIAFGKKVRQRQVEEKVEHRTIKNMSEYHWKCLEVLKRKHAVEIQVQGTIITVSGFKDFVPAAMSDVKLLLEKITNWVSDEQILKTIQWVRHDPGSTDTTPYSAEAIVFMENAWKMKMNTVDILLDNQPHTVNFEKMQEHNKASGKSVKISRKLIDLGDLSEDVPEEEYSLLSNLPEASKLDEDSDEFQDVVKSFYETIQEFHSKIRIIQVEKLMNRLLYNQYKLKKASVLQRASHPDIERTLYHGTSETSVKEICVHGFNRSFCGKNATVYGQGVYFAVKSGLSVQDQYSPPNANGYKFVFVSKVLTGDYTKGCHSMKTAPLKETGDIPLRYDSVTDDITKPSMFIIFNDTQAFPEYLITCQRIYR